MMDKSDRIGSPLVHIERAGYLCTPTFSRFGFIGEVGCGRGGPS
jgi:hypothetical protein